MASRTICLTAATAAIIPIAEKTIAIVTFNQKIMLLFDGLKNTTGKIKSGGMKPKAPINELISPKNGGIAVIVVAMMTDDDLENALRITFRAANSFLRRICKGVLEHSICRLQVNLWHTMYFKQRVLQIEEQKGDVHTTATADSWRMVKILVIETKKLPRPVPITILFYSLIHFN